MPPILHRATEADIPEMHRIRLSVRENRVSDPARLTEADYRPFIADQGETWHARIDGKIAGFGTLDESDQSIWALFVHPDFEGMGLGKLLLAKLVDRARESQMGTINLVTTPGTRAEAFYLRCGWEPAGVAESGECRLALNLH